MPPSSQPSAATMRAAVRAAALATEFRTAWITTVRPDGSPHTTPVWFVLVDTTVWFASAEHNVKVSNIGADPRVSVALDGSTEAPLVAEGIARVHGLADVAPAVLADFAAKYDGWDVADASVDGTRVVIGVTITRWLLAG